MAWKGSTNGVQNVSRGCLKGDDLTGSGLICNGIFCPENRFGLKRVFGSISSKKESTYKEEAIGREVIWQGSLSPVQPPMIPGKIPNTQITTQVKHLAL